MKVLIPTSLEVELKQVWQRLGYDGSAQASLPIRLAFTQAVEIGRELLKPAACYDIFPLEEVIPPLVKLEGIFFTSEEISVRCRGAQELAVFVVTIGPQLEKRVEQLFRTKPAMTLILDNYGSETVVALACQVRQVIREYARSKGYQVGERYCPGYGDWNTKELQKLFRLIGGNKIGVKLKASSMMWPRKSYACVLPIGAKVSEAKVDELCARS